MNTLWLPHDVFGLMSTEASRATPLETGGLMLGYVNGDAAVVERVIGPGPNAKHQRFRFSPDVDYQCDEIVRLYAESGRSLEYLGDWHTHPGGPAILSGVDLACMRDIAKQESARCPRPIMVILNESPWKANAFVMLPEGVRTMAVRAYSASEAA